MEVVNLFAYKATYVDDMLAAPDPIGPDNDKAIVQALDTAGLVICAWGNLGGHLGRSRQVLAMIRNCGYLPKHLGLNKTGEPKHPLYLSYKVTPTPF